MFVYFVAISCASLEFSFDVCSKVFAALTPIRDNSLALFLACCREFFMASAYPNMTLLVSLVTVNILSA